MIKFPSLTKPKVDYDYLPLLAALAATVIIVRFFNSPLLLVFVTLIISAIYIAWGVIHHKKSGHIDKKIVLEYSGIALLVNIIIITLVS